MIQFSLKWWCFYSEPFFEPKRLSNDDFSITTWEWEYESGRKKEQEFCAFDSSQSHLKVSPQSFRSHTKVILESSWSHLKVIQRSSSSHPRVIPKSSKNHPKVVKTTKDQTSFKICYQVKTKQKLLAFKVWNSGIRNFWIHVKVTEQIKNLTKIQSGNKLTVLKYVWGILWKE